MSSDGNNGTDGIPEGMFAGRPAVITPRQSTYVHRPIIVVDHDTGIGHLEDATEVVSLHTFVVSEPSHIWVTPDPSELLGYLDHHLGISPHWTYQLACSSTENTTRSKLTRFGMSSEYYKELGLRKQRSMHLCWAPFDMLSAPDDILGDGSVAALLRFAQDVRDWLATNDMPIPTSLSGIGTALLRDPRFYPDARARVPHATNDRIRKYLPAVYQELRTVTSKRHDVVAIDQTGAYHRIAQEVAMPDAQTLYARGNFSIDLERDAPVWLRPNEPEYAEVLAAPGIVLVNVMARQRGKKEWRPPAVETAVTGERIYAWTNEIAFMEERGMTVLGIIAAWVAEEADKGLPKYGAWAQQEISKATLYRRQWLKPALHSTYGLLGAKERVLRIGRRIGRGAPSKWMLGIRQFFVRESEFDHKPPLANVAQLGTLQAEVRQRSLKMANALTTEGATVTHVHADGLHVVGNMPLIDLSTWHMEERTNLRYLNKVSWVSDQGAVLPGIPEKQRHEWIKHDAHARAAHSGSGSPEG